MDIEKIIENIVVKKLTGETPENKSSLWPQEWRIGQSVIIRTVTYHYVGRIKAVEDRFLILEECSWVADSGRWNQALTTGVLEEVEPMPNPVGVSIGAIVDVTEWKHELPKEVK